MPSPHPSEPDEPAFIDAGHEESPDEFAPPDLDPGPVPAHPAHPAHPAALLLWQWALLAEVVLVGCYLVYGWLPISLLRAESGLYLNRGAGETAELQQFAWKTIAGSYNGHYLPVVLNLELACAALFGMSEIWWKLRQLVYLSLFVLAAVSLWRTVAVRLGLPRAGRLALPLGAAAFFAGSPLVIELVTWPFMGLHLLWAALTTWSLSWLGRALPDPALGDDGDSGGDVSLRALTFSLLCAYGSLHCLGLGLATMAGYITAIAVLFAAAWTRGAAAAMAAQRRGLVLLGGAAVALAVVHGSMMIFTLPPAATPRAAAFPGGPMELGAQTLGYIACSVIACVRSFWSPNAWAWPRIDFLAQDWPYGVGVVLLALLYAGRLWQRSRSAGRGADGVRLLNGLCWHAFSLGAFGFSVLMIAGRVWQGEPWFGYLLGSRYLWPLGILLSGTLASAVLALRFSGPFGAPTLGVVLGAVALTGNLVYQREVVPKVWPHLTLSHEAVWRNIVAMTRELRDAGLPLPDLPMRPLGMEFPEPLHFYESLLRRTARLPTGSTLEWIAPPKISRRLWQDMKTRSPALAGLTQSVFAETDRTLTTPPAVTRQPDGSSSIALTDPALLRDVQLEQIKATPNLGVSIDVTGVPRNSIWINPPTAVSYPGVPLGKNPVLRCFIAIHPLIWNDTGADGALFRVSVQVNGTRETVAERYLNPIARPDERKWNAFDVDLSKYAGRQVDLILENAAGPAKNDYGDWCIWGDAVLVEGAPAAAGR